MQSNAHIAQAIYISNRTGRWAEMVRPGMAKRWNGTRAVNSDGTARTGLSRRQDSAAVNWHAFVCVHLNRVQCVE